MKSIVSICIALFGVVFLVSIAKSSEAGLASAWLFEEASGKTVKDFVGGNDGEIKGSVERVATGKFGRALKFPGKGDSYVSIPYNDVFDSEPYTFAAWVKLDPASWQYIAWQNGLVWPEPHMKRHIDIWVHQDGYVVLMWYLEDGGQGRADGKTIVADSKWHHVAKAACHSGSNWSVRRRRYGYNCRAVDYYCRHYNRSPCGDLKQASPLSL